MELEDKRAEIAVHGRWVEQSGPGAGPFTDEEKRIVTNAQRELGNNWTKIAERLPGRSGRQVANHWHNRLYLQRERRREGTARTRVLTEEEKRIVVDAQKELGNKWTEIAERLPGRSVRQVAGWWHSRLYVQRERERRREGRVRTGAFTEEEKRILMDAQRELGNRWTQIAERLPGRSVSQVRGWWHNRFGAHMEQSYWKGKQSEANNLYDNIIGEEETQVMVSGGSDCQKVREDRWEEDEPSTPESIKEMSYDQVMQTAYTPEMTSLGIGKTYVGMTNTAEMQTRNNVQVEQLMEETTNLHARQIIKGTTFEQAMQIHLRQLMPPGNGASHEMMAEAIDQAIAQEVQWTALANDFHARMMAKKDQRIAAMEQIIAEKDSEIMHLKGEIARLGAEGKEPKKKEAQEKNDEKERIEGTLSWS